MQKLLHCSLSGVSFEKIIQMPLEEKGKAEIVIVTHRASLADYDYILHTLQGYEEIDCLKANYRIEGMLSSISYHKTKEP